MTMMLSDSRATERDALRTRICILEAALACVERETAVALATPEISFVAVNRIASVARQARSAEEASP